MTLEFGSTILGTTQTAPEPEDYTGADGLLYCGKCKKRKKPISRRIRRLSSDAPATRQSATVSGKSARNGKPRGTPPPP